jgi:hypothetical protein
MKTLQEFDKKFSQIKNRGYIKSNRKGDTGVGKTLEDLFEIVENNSKKSDLKIGELKAFRMCTSSLLTLLTCDYRAWLIRPRQVIEKYGYLSEETNLLCLRTSVGSNPNNRGFYFTFNDEFLQVNHTDGAEILKWKWDEAPISLSFVYDFIYKTKSYDYVYNMLWCVTILENLSNNLTFMKNVKNNFKF